MHIREKKQFENYHFQIFFRPSYLLHPISLNLNKVEIRHTYRRKADIVGIVFLYYQQIKPEIRAFRLKKFDIKVQFTLPNKFYWQLKFLQKLQKMGWKNEVSLTDKFYGLAGVYHQYVFKYEINKKIPATV